jgi:hypothetical protein
MYSLIAIPLFILLIAVVLIIIAAAAVLVIRANKDHS